jgi:hypothetical protein
MQTTKTRFATHAQIPTLALRDHRTCQIKYYYKNQPNAQFCLPQLHYIKTEIRNSYRVLFQYGRHQEV